MSTARFRFRAQAVPYDGPAAWVFAALPQDVADDIHDRFAPRAAGFGSIRVEVTVGSTTWRTSLFPARDGGPYHLPLKRAVRESENLEAGEWGEFALVVLDD